MSASLWSVGELNLITIQTNSTWEQKVRIIGEGVNKSITGRGEGVIHWEIWTGPGSWLIDAWHRSPGASEWVPSKLIHGQWDRGFYYVGANDGGKDQDYNDVLVSSHAVTKMALESAGQFLNSLDE